MWFGELCQNYFLCFDSKKSIYIFCVWIKRYVKLSHFQMCLNIECFRHPIFHQNIYFSIQLTVFPHHCVVLFCSLIMSQVQTQLFRFY